LPRSCRSPRDIPVRLWRSRSVLRLGCSTPNQCRPVAPGLQRTIKCQTCKLWSHSDCVGYSKNGFTCWLCLRRGIQTSAKQGDVADAGLASFPEASEGGTEYQVANVGTEHDDPVFFEEVANREDTLMAATSETLYAIFEGFPVSAPPMHRATPIGAAVNSKFIVRRRQDVTFVCHVPGCRGVQKTVYADRWAESAP
jgi:hypothetical protein